MPQGGLLNPICAQIMLNELERRCHKYVCYADDMAIFCKNKARAEQTRAHIIPLIEKKLFLKVNSEKTVVYAGKIKYLGYGFYKGNDGFHMRVHEKTKQRTQKRVNEQTSRKRVNDHKVWQKAIKQYVT